MRRLIRPGNLRVVPRAYTETVTETTVTLRVDGLFCDVCATRVQTRLASLPGVESVSCTIDTERALIEFDPARVTPAELERRAESAAILMPLRRMLATTAWGMTAVVEGRTGIRRV